MLVGAHAAMEEAACESAELSDRGEIDKAGCGSGQAVVIAPLHVFLQKRGQDMECSTSTTITTRMDVEV